MGVTVGPNPIGGYNTATYTKAAVQTGGAAAWLTTSSPLTLFTVTGTVLARVFGVVGATAFTSTNDDGTLAIGIVAATGLFIPATTVNNAGGTLAIGNIWQDATPTLKGEVLAATPLAWATVVNTPIILTIATNSMTAGAITLYCQWVPLSAGATVV